jgi:hypothetical protein
MTPAVGGAQTPPTANPTTADAMLPRCAADNSASIALSSVLQYRYVIIPRGALGPPGT